MPDDIHLTLFCGKSITSPLTVTRPREPAGPVLPSCFFLFLFFPSLCSFPPRGPPRRRPITPFKSRSSSRGRRLLNDANHLPGEEEHVLPLRGSCNPQDDGYICQDEARAVRGVESARGLCVCVYEREEERDATTCLLYSHLDSPD